MKNGETEAVTFVYTIADLDGGTNTATVAIVVDGIGNVPVVRRMILDQNSQMKQQ